jgi:hypothetical protein
MLLTLHIRVLFITDRVNLTFILFPEPSNRGITTFQARNSLLQQVSEKYTLRIQLLWLTECKIPTPRQDTHARRHTDELPKIHPLLK